MSITVKIDLGYEFDVKAKAAEVFDLLSDVPTSVSHFPKVEKLTDLGGGVYQWEMEKVGTSQVNIQTVYASKYASDKAKGTVKWTPVKGRGQRPGGRPLEDRGEQEAPASPLPFRAKSRCHCPA
jgi:carbon monoxide dehydrogenase subunit G